MNNYVIFADSACDISPSVLADWGVRSCSLTFSFTNSDLQYADCSMPYSKFYERMRKGDVAKTSAVSVSIFEAAFEEVLKTGSDIFYLGFSSGLSNTVNAGSIAAKNLAQKYPERCIAVVDSLAASAGYGLLLYLAVEQKKSGADLDAVAAYAESMRLKICHWFTVDDLVFLKRGGRVSATTAFAGNLLGIKPVLHVDNDGHLINITKVRGRATSIHALADKFGELAVKDSPIFISHGDCLEDAEKLAEILREKYQAQVSLTTYVGSVIGAHSGPGTLALFFVTDKER